MILIIIFVHYCNYYYTTILPHFQQLYYHFLYCINMILSTINELINISNSIIHSQKINIKYIFNLLIYIYIFNINDTLDVLIDCVSAYRHPRTASLYSHLISHIVIYSYSQIFRSANHFFSCTLLPTHHYTLTILYYIDMVYSIFSIFYILIYPIYSSFIISHLYILDLSYLQNPLLSHNNDHIIFYLCTIVQILDY